jgi:CAAX prenyl protease-like protein
MSYPLAYALRIACTLAAMALVWPVYRQFEFRVNWLAVIVGLLGAPLWIGLSLLQRDFVHLPENVATWIGGARAGYDPLTELGDQPGVLVGFLAVRFLGLALIVPIIEEFFLRGFFARMVADADWWKIPIGAVSASSLAAIVGYAALTHPGELLAAVAWFLLVTWLVARSQNIWDAVLAHATTNLLLGVWVLATKQFWLW